jgi:ATP-dependent DNA ligase
MLCYPFEEKRLKKWNTAVLVQPKLDGVRCLAYCARDYVELYSSTGEPIFSVPHIERDLKTWSKNSTFEEPIILDGELYEHGKPFEEINSVVSRRVNFLTSSMQFHIFDIASKDIQGDRWLKFRGKLWPFVKLGNSLKLVETEFIEKPSPDQILTIMNRYCDEGYEGIIVRHIANIWKPSRSTYVMKFKPKKSDIYKITGYVEEVSIDGEPKGALGALWLSSGEEEFRVGSGFTRSQREVYWELREELVGKYCKINYQHTTPGRGVPRFPVFVEILKELK